MQETLNIKYPLPDFLKGKCTQSFYSKWLANKADDLMNRDMKHDKPYMHGISLMEYRRKIHEAVIETGLYDPYTGDELRWDLIGTWDADRIPADSGKYKKKYALMPTVDHIDPEATTLELEICSWQVNDCKSDFNPADFAAFCVKVVEHWKGKGRRRTNAITKVPGKAS
jgi:hypothetical protein